MEPQMNTDERRYRSSVSSLLCSVVLSLSFPVAAETDSRPAASAPKSILDARADYHGPERQEPEPLGFPDIGIGFFAPHTSESPIGEGLWRGATLAIEHANKRGGYRGKPFRLVPRWADDPWGAGSREMTRLVYEDRVWAVIGSIDGASTHIAEQVATKARITLVSPLSGDPTLTHTAVPWMFRLPPDDSAVAEVLARIAVEQKECRRIVVLTSADHDGRTGGREIASSLGRRRVAAVLHLKFDPSQTDFSQQLSRVESIAADAVFLWGSPDSSLRLLTAMRERGVALPVFGPASFSLPSFLREAEAAAEGLTTCSLAWEQDGIRTEEFAEKYRARFGGLPGDDALLGYDSADIVIRAICSAGLNRARIRDAVVEMSGYAGLAGTITWDNGGGNMVVPAAVTIRNGRPVTQASLPPPPSQVSDISD
jgi:ABC-type branched-subunit amino acid transport system substrate-binding protein